MKPRHFIQSPLSTTASETQRALDPVDAESLGQTVFVKADIDRDDAPFTFLDGIFNVKVSGKDTQGRCVIFDTLRPNKVGPALHLHTDCDEWFFVREGEFKFQVGEDTLRLKPGDSLLVPQGVKHAFIKTSEGVARLIVMHQPAATMEEFFRTGAAYPNMSSADRRVLGEPLKPD